MLILPRQSLVLPICGLVMGSFLLILMVVSPVVADMGVQPILPGGSNIQPEGETAIQMASE